MLKICLQGGPSPGCLYLEGDISQENFSFSGSTMSSDQKYIIVNNETGNAIVGAFSDLAGYIDQRNKNAEGPMAVVAAEFANAVGESTEVPSSTQKYFEEIAKSSKVLISSPPAEFEGALNLLWYVLSSAPNFEALIPVVLNELTATFPTVHGQKIALLAVLGNLFNITPAGSKEKPLVFTKIVDLAAASQAANQFVAQFGLISQWLKEWKYDNTEKLVLELVNGVTFHELEVLQFLRDVAVAFPELNEIARKLVDLTLKTPSSRELLSLEDLLSLEAVANLSKSSNAEDQERVKLVKAIAEGDYASFLQLSDKFSNNTVLKKQARIAAISRLASSSNTRELKYADIASALQLPESEIEAVIVDAAKSGVVKGRLNQLKGTFAVEYATLVGPVTDEHWSVIESRLKSWRKNLNAIFEVSDKAKNNRDLVKSLNKLEVN